MNFSIITATFNNCKTINRCLFSIESQSYKNFEHIIIDGCSTDNTLNLINSFDCTSKKFIISEPDSGLYYALNKGLRLAKGDIICFLHADDYFANNNILKLVIDTFNQYLYIDAVYVDIIYFKELSPDKVFRKWNSKKFKKNLINMGWMPPHTSLFVKKSSYDKIGNYDTKYSISSDYNSIIKLFSLPSFQAQYVPKVMVHMQSGGMSNSSIKNIFIKSLEDFKIMYFHSSSFFQTLFIIVMKNISKLVQFRL